MSMPLGLAIALRHLSHRRRQTVTSLVGVALGVAFFIAIAAMMQGFQHDFIDKVINVSPHVTMKDEFRAPRRQAVERAFPEAAIALHGLKPRDEVRGIRGSRAILAALADLPGARVAPTLSGQVLLHFGGKDLAVTLTGIVPEKERYVTKLESYLLDGSLDELYTTTNGILLGEGVAQKLAVSPGDLVTAVSPVGVVMKMKVTGIFRSGITNMDNIETYVLLKKAQILQDRANIVNRIRLRLDDVDAAVEVARRLENRFGYRTESWQEQSSNVLGIFVIQNVIIYSTVSAILIVACFGIFNVISTVVFEKTRDIGILKSMGFRDEAIRRIFMLEGALVGLAGVLLGWSIGYGLVEFMAGLKFPMEGFIKSQGFILYRTPLHYLISGGMGLSSAVFAAWLPARRASRLNPVDIVRGAA